MLSKRFSINTFQQGDFVGLLDFLCGSWKAKYENCQQQLRWKEELLQAQVKLTEAALRLRDAETILKEHYRLESEALASLLDKAIQFPLFPEYVGDGQEVCPWNYEPLLPYLRESCDWEYFTLPFEDWSVILPNIYTAIKATLGSWEVDINDCDNFALTFHAIIALVARDSGFDKQLAFAWARSPTHGYNAFIDTNGDIWVFEPQTGCAIGKLGETDTPHDTIRIYFLN